MNQSIDRGKIQNDLWGMIEMTLNSQIVTPITFRKFKSLKNLYCEKLGFLKNNTSNKLKNPIDVISYLYENYLDLMETMPNRVQNVTVMFNNRFELNKYSDEVSSFLGDFQRYVKAKISPFTHGVFIHGSIATNDYTGFSDVDAGIIVKDEVMMDEKRLRQLKKNITGALRLILKFDNLQHHGFFIMPEGFLNYYPEEYLPVEVFRYAKAIDKNFIIEVKKSNNIEFAKKKLFSIVEAFERLSRLPGNLYDFKHKFSTFMLLPSLYLQTKGVYVYKKYSYDKVKKEFAKDWWIMDEVSQIRQEWIRPRSRLFNNTLDAVSNPWIASTIYRKLNWKIPSWLIKKLNPNLYIGIKNLAQKMIQ